MNKDKGPLSWLQSLIMKKKDEEGRPEQEKKPSMHLYVLVVLVIGAAIMMASNFITKSSQDASKSSLPVFKEEQSQDVEVFGRSGQKADPTIADYERTYENQIKEALETITGVDDVTVVVNVDSSERKVYEKNLVTQKQVTDETDREGGKRVVEDSSKDEKLVIIRNGEKEVPIVQETKKPNIRGVLVVAKGADNIQIKKWIVEAVTRALDVPSHRVAVMPKK
ncbi:stage III sporulation protein AG [Peribacillus alkalitolerans]|uniref:stage III sporulation protein AG n=1 Tax=Peribacillus alkalitolerans TaxID=1550385 RepID=UPI0013D78A72|nr:stage III sporulation protein AG [Peribacillus alkalitolerans]